MTGDVTRPAGEGAPQRLEDQLCFPLYAAARKAVNRYTPVLKPLGLTYTQYIVMLVLWERGSCTVGELCRALYLDNGTVTPLLKKLEEAGHITRARAEDDERVVSLRVTEKGYALREKARDVPLLVGKCLPLCREDAKELYRLLGALLDMP